MRLPFLAQAEAGSTITIDNPTATHTTRIGRFLPDI